MSARMCQPASLAPATLEGLNVDAAELVPDRSREAGYRAYAMARVNTVANSAVRLQASPPGLARREMQASQSPFLRGRDQMRV